MLDKIRQNRFYINYSRMWPYVKPIWFRALLSMLICIPIGSLDAVIALALKPYMDLVMVEKSISSPWYIPLGIVAFTSLQGVLKYLSAYLSTWVGMRITNGLKFDLYKKLLTLPTTFFDKQNSGDVIFQFNNMADSACSGLLNNLSVFTQRIFSSVSLVCVLFYNSWQLALIAVIVLGGAFAPVANIQKRIKKVLEKTVVADSAIITAYNETFAGNKTITSYNLQNSETNKFKWILGNIFNLRIKMVQKTQWLSPMMHVIVSVGIAVAIGYGSHLIMTEQITSGNFVSFITALILLYTPVKNIGNNLNAVQMSFFAIEQIFSLLTAIIVTISIRWTGLLVINSLLVLPAAASRLVTKCSRTYLLTSILISILSSILGLAISYYAGSASGATIVLVNAVAFIICLILPNLLKIITRKK